MIDGLDIETLLKTVEPWRSDNDETLVCRAVRQETSDVQSFLFASSSPRRFQFKPAQFLTFSFQLTVSTLTTCYTIPYPPPHPSAPPLTFTTPPPPLPS